MDADALPRGWHSGAVAVLGAALLAVAAFAPWIASPDGSHAGVADAVRDGYVTFLAGVVAAVVIVGREWDRAGRLAAGVVGVVALGLAAYWYGQVGGTEFELAPGLYATALAGLLLLGGALYGAYEVRSARSARADPERTPAEDGDPS